MLLNQKMLNLGEKLQTEPPLLCDINYNVILSYSIHKSVCIYNDILLNQKMLTLR